MAELNGGVESWQNGARGGMEYWVGDEAMADWVGGGGVMAELGDIPGVGTL